MKIKELSASIPPRHREDGLRAAERRVCGEVRGNVFFIQAAYRLCGRLARRNDTMPSYSDMPARLRKNLSRGQHLAICSRLEAILLELADPYLEIEYLPASDPEDEDERARRVKIYQQVANARRARLGEEDDALERQGPKARAVWCLDLLQPFPSARAAAKWASAQSGHVIARSAIRRAIKTKTHCAGYRWGYDHFESRSIVPSGRSRKVCCVYHEGDKPDPIFESQTLAALHAGVAQSTMSAALDGDGWVGDRRYEYAKPEVAEPRKRKAKPKLDWAQKFPLFA